MSTDKSSQVNTNSNNSNTNSATTEQANGSMQSSQATGQQHKTDQPKGASSLDRLLKDMQRKQASESSILVKNISKTVKQISEFGAEIKVLQFKNKPIPKILKREGHVKEVISTDEKRGNRVRIQELKAQIAKLKILLKKYRSELKAAVDKEAWLAKLETIKTNTQDQTYITKGKTFLSRKFSKALQGILNGEYVTQKITIESLVSLRALATQNPVSVIDFDREMEKTLDKMSDGELAAFYSHDLKKLLRDAIIEVLKKWDPKKHTQIPEITFPKAESADGTEDKNESGTATGSTSSADVSTGESTVKDNEMETVPSEDEVVETF